MQGLIGIGRITGRADLIAGARRLADAQIRIMHADGYIPGRQTADFFPAVNWCCLTGSAQTSTVWSQLYLLTHEEKYRAAAQRVNLYLMARHDIRILILDCAGECRVLAGLGRLRPAKHPQLATKFFVDALSLEARISRNNPGVHCRWNVPPDREVG